VAMIAASLALTSTASAEPSDQRESTQAQADPGPIAASTGHPDQIQTNRVHPGSGSIATGTGETISSDIFSTMMEYRKLINRERREDRKAKSGDARLRVHVPDGPQKSRLSICEAAKSARDRNSPAVPGLAKQCLDSGDSVPQ
ncbi:MAG: hypothetical protein LH610_05335, partial [Sphingomonas bacterium]|nr:hypothetical protein [Sphingomonas bacterium]